MLFSNWISPIFEKKGEFKFTWLALLFKKKIKIQNVEYIDCTSAEGHDPPNECSAYHIKNSDDKVPVMQELWAMWGTNSLVLLQGLLWPGVGATDRVLRMG